MDFDSIIVSHVGEFGLYQKLVVLLLGCVAVTVTSHNFIHAFTGAEPDVICLGPSMKPNILDNLEPILNVTASISSKTYQNDSNAFIINYCISYFHTSVFSSPNNSDVCPKYGFDKTVYQSTIVTEWLLVCEHKWLSALSQSLHMAGCFMGSVIFGHLTDSVGRWTILQVTCIFNTLVGIACALVPHFWLYCLMRFILGMIVAGQFNAAYVLALELVGPSYRQFTAICMLLYSSLGVMLLAGCAYLIRDWWLLQIATSLPSAFLFLLYLGIPESPRWLLNNNRHKKAVKVINTMIKYNNKPAINTQAIIEEYRQSKALMESKIDLKTTSRNYTIVDLCRTPRIRLNTLLIFILWFIISTSFYGLSLYSSTLDGNAFLNLLLSGVVEVPAYIVSVYLSHRFGNKPTLASALVISGIVLLATIFTSDHIAMNIALTLIGKLGISVTYATVYPFATEVFPTVIRAIGLGATSTGARLGGFIAPYINLLGDFEKAVPLIVFGAMSVFGVIAVAFLPETRGHPLPETIIDAEKLETSCICCRSSQKKSMDEKSEVQESELGILKKL